MQLISCNPHRFPPETIRCWANNFGPAIVANIDRARVRPDCGWHLDEMVVRIARPQACLGACNTRARKRLPPRVQRPPAIADI